MRDPVVFWDAEISEIAGSSTTTGVTGELPLSPDISRNHQVSFPVALMELLGPLSHPVTLGRIAVSARNPFPKRTRDRSEIGDTDRMIERFSCRCGVSVSTVLWTVRYF